MRDRKHSAQGLMHEVDEESVMQVEQVKALLEGHFPDCHIAVDGDGSHFDLTIVSDAFEGLPTIKKQQMVYAAINDQIVSGNIHAVNMKLYTPAQWQSQ